MKSEITEIWAAEWGITWRANFVRQGISTKEGQVRFSGGDILKRARQGKGENFKTLQKGSLRWEESWNRVSKHLGFEQSTFSLYWSRILFFNKALNIFREVAFWKFSGRVFHISVTVFWKLFFNLFELNDGGFRFWGLFVTDLVTLMLLLFCSSRRERISGANPFSMSYVNPAHCKKYWSSIFKTLRFFIRGSEWENQWHLVIDLIDFFWMILSLFRFLARQAPQISRP